MKLTISAKELLALHNLLRDNLKFNGMKMDDTQSSEEEPLRQVYGRIRACVLSSLSNKLVDPIDNWFDREQAKIDALRDQNEDVKRYQNDLASSAPAITAPVGMVYESNGDGSDPEFIYPRPKTARQGKPHHGKR